MEGLDFSTIIITLDYYIRKIMALLDKLLLMFGSSTTTAPTTTEAPEEVV